MNKVLMKENENGSFDIYVNGNWLRNSEKGVGATLCEAYNSMEQEIDLLDNISKSLGFDFQVERL